jgi:hypothetical protein
MFYHNNLSTDEPALPSPTMTSTAMFNYFQQEFGFTQAQVTYNKIIEVLLKGKAQYS